MSDGGRSNSDMIGANAVVKTVGWKMFAVAASDAAALYDEPQQSSPHI